MVYSGFNTNHFVGGRGKNMEKALGEILRWYYVHPQFNHKSSEDTVFSFWEGGLGSGEQMDIHEGKELC